MACLADIVVTGPAPPHLGAPRDQAQAAVAVVLGGGGAELHEAEAGPGACFGALAAVCVVDHGEAGTSGHGTEDADWHGGRWYQ